MTNNWCFKIPLQPMIHPLFPEILPLTHFFTERKVVAQRFDEVIQVNLNVDEDVKHFNAGRHGIHGHETTVAVVDHELGAERFGRQIVDATRAVSHVAHD